MGKFGRAVRRIASDDEVIEAEDLQRQAASQGATAVSQCPNRESVTIMGTVRSLTFRPRAGAPALEVELYDGSGVVTLIWLGRRELAGVTPGRKIRACGRITDSSGRRVMFNPRYEFVLKAC
jgi:RecG-like helicase